MVRFRSCTLRRLLAAVVLAGLTLAGARAALPVVRFGGLDYVDMVDACGRMGVTFSFTANGRSMLLRNANHSGELLPPGDGSHRLLILDGVRVFMGDLVAGRMGRFFISRTDFERRLFPLFRPDLFVPPPRRPHLIVIDAGHGGVDPGTHNARYHLDEKTMTLDVAKRLRPLLLAQGWAVAMIRERDTQITPDKKPDLELRARYAEQQHADVYVSIHFDAGPAGSRGSMVLQYNPPGQKSTFKWSTPRSSDARGPEKGNRNDPWNSVLAHAVYRNLPRLLGTTDVGERIQDISVLRNAAMPAILVESAYLSNDAEAQRLMDPHFRQRIAEAIAKGLGDYRSLIDSLQPAVPALRAKP